MATQGNNGIGYVVHYIIISAAVVGFPSHVCVAIEIRVGTSSEF